MLSNFTLNSKVLNFGYAMKNINKAAIDAAIVELQVEMNSCGIPMEQYKVETPNGCKKEQMLNEYKRIATVYMEFLQSSNEEPLPTITDEVGGQGEPKVEQVEEQPKKASKKESKKVAKEPKAKKQSKGEGEVKSGRLEDANARLSRYTLELEQRSAAIPEGETERQNNKRVASLKRKIARAQASIQKNTPVVK